eukprot:7437161-Alexandrium_andersonii.AAC.1
MTSAPRRRKSVRACVQVKWGWCTSNERVGTWAGRRCRDIGAERTCTARAISPPPPLTFPASSYLECNVASGALRVCAGPRRAACTRPWLPPALARATGD